MPTVFTHAVIPLVLGLSLGQAIISKRLLIAGVIASVVPDLDVIAFRLGIHYLHELGHRGFSHSLSAALLLGALASAFAPHLHATRKAAFCFVAIAAASHGLLDMLTNGGHGVAIAWPFSEQRFFFPWQVVEASPLSLRRLFGPAGLAVFKSELLWVWLPSILVGLALFTARRKNAR